MSFEADVADLNQFYFFQEFAFSKTTFSPQAGSELELADSIVWLHDLLIVYQLKDRNAPKIATPETERRWFERKVLGAATRQIRDTLSYLQDHPRVEVRNGRGHVFNLAATSLRQIHKLVLYRGHELLPESCTCTKWHKSETVGIIHVIAAEDYIGILRTLLTPAEVAEYLRWRASLIDRWGDSLAALPEQVLVGHYLHGDLEREPAPECLNYLRTLEQETELWDISRIIKLFPERQTTNNAPTDYYRIVEELAKLTRGELAEFKARFKLSMDKAAAKQSVLPYRVSFPRTACGFLFVPLPDECVTNRRVYLTNLTTANKYDQRLAKCIGVSFARDDDGWFSVEWCYREFPWVKSPQIEKLLLKTNPFRPVKEGKVSRYRFSGTD